MSRYTRTQRLIALGYGIVCHSVFLAAIASMALALYTGLGSGLGRLTGRSAAITDLLLVVQFPVLHSWLLTPRGRRLLGRLAPAGLGRDLGSTLYATTASLQLLVAFVGWSPSGRVWWTAPAAVRPVFDVAFALSWLVLLKAMADAGLPLQTGFLGWGSVVRGRAPSFDGFPTRGLFAWVRQPIYLAFSLILWTGPCWTPDRALLVAGWTAYCLAGPRLKERRYLRAYGDAFAAYQRTVPYWMPLPRKDLTSWT